MVTVTNILGSKHSRGRFSSPSIPVHPATDGITAHMCGGRGGAARRGTGPLRQNALARTGLSLTRFSPILTMSLRLDFS